jgi:hypothetical protein
MKMALGRREGIPIGVAFCGYAAQPRPPYTKMSSLCRCSEPAPCRSLLSITEVAGTPSITYLLDGIRHERPTFRIFDRDVKIVAI